MYFKSGAFQIFEVGYVDIFEYYVNMPELTLLKYLGIKHITM